MAYEIPILKDSREAAATMSAKQYYVVILSGTKADIPTTATKVPYGILQNKPDSGGTAEIMVVGISKVSSDAALAVGDLIGSSGDGQLLKLTPGTDTTKYVIGQVVEASDNAGEFASAAINGASPHRAA